MNTMIEDERTAQFQAQEAENRVEIYRAAAEFNRQARHEAILKRANLREKAEGFENKLISFDDGELLFDNLDIECGDCSETKGVGIRVDVSCSCKQDSMIMGQIPARLDGSVLVKAVGASGAVLGTGYYVAPWDESNYADALATAGFPTEKKFQTVLLLSKDGRKINAEYIDHYECEPVKLWLVEI